MSESTKYLALFGDPLMRLGYDIVPIKSGHKFPKGLPGWDRVEADASKLGAWLSNGFADGGVGVLTKHTPAIDIDIYDAGVSEKITNWCIEHLGAVVQRVGEAPKSLLVFRTETPFAKMVSNTYEDFLGVRHRVEVLGDGQQFVAFAMHPGTQQPYTWVSEKSLIDVPHSDLPVLAPENVQALFEYIDSIKPADWSVVSPGQGSKVIDTSMPAADRAFMNAKPKVDMPAEKIAKAVNMLDPNMSNDSWVKIGMGLHHQFDGGPEGFNIFNEWSSAGVTYDADTIGARWQSFGADLTSTNPVTAATIISQAKAIHIENKARDDVARGFSLVPASQILAKLGPVDWQVENYFEADTTGILFGDPGCFKSFLALDIGLHCALGRDWHGNAVKQGSVIYVAGEGHGGFARRLAAFEKAHGTSIDDKLPLYFSEHAASLYTEESALMVTASIDALIASAGVPSLIIIDTLARNFGAGDENSTSDMNVFIENVDRQLRAKYKSTVLIVHHTGHSNKERARGSMALKGALDFEYRVEKPEGFTGYNAKLVCTKMKDAIEPEDTWFEGQSIVVGSYDDDEMTSLVFKKSEAPVAEDVPLKGKQKECYELLKNEVQEGEGLSKKAVQKLLVDAEISKSNDQARSVVNAMLLKGYLIDFDGFISVSEF